MHSRLPRAGMRRTLTDKTLEEAGGAKNPSGPFAPTRSSR